MATLRGLFDELDKKLVAKVDAYESYALDIAMSTWERQGLDRASRQEQARQLSEARAFYARALERARVNVAMYALNTLGASYDDVLSVLQDVGFGTQLLHEQEYLQKIGLKKESVVKLGNLTLTVCGQPIMALLEGADNSILPAVWYRVRDQFGNENNRLDRVDASGLFSWRGQRIDGDARYATRDEDTEFSQSRSLGGGF